MSARDPRSGVDEHGEWTPAFEGQRPAFSVGNRVAVGNRGPLKHGAYGTLALRPRAAEIAAVLAEAAPAATPGSEIFVQSAAMIGARFEAAIGALLDADDVAEVEILDVRAARWARLWLGALDRLGLSPLAAARLGLDLSRARGEALRAHLADTYGPSGEGEGS